MALSLPVVGPVINTRILTDPWNYATVFIVASLWLLLFHTVMQAFGAMKTNVGATIGANPGQVTAPTMGTVANFATPGVLAGGAAQVPGLFDAGPATLFADGSEAKYAEDGWIS